MTTRRNLLKGAAGLCGAAALPGWAGLFEGSNASAGSVLLFTDRPDASLRGASAVTTIEHRSLSLELAADRAHVDGLALLGAGHGALVALGTPAAVFALRTQLGSHWRVIAQGLHGADGPGIHRLDAPPVLAHSLSKVFAQVRSEEEFAAVLLTFAGQRDGIWPAERTNRRLHSHSWDGSARASLLAAPMRTEG